PSPQSIVALTFAPGVLSVNVSSTADTGTPAVVATAARAGAGSASTTSSPVTRSAVGGPGDGVPPVTSKISPVPSVITTRVTTGFGNKRPTNDVAPVGAANGWLRSGIAPL